MNILFISTHLNTGGITSYLLAITKGLLSRGHKVVLVHSGGDREEDFLGMGVECITVNIKTKSDVSWKIYAAIPALCKLVKEKNIDVIHANARITQVLGAILGKINNIPYVTTCHGFFKRKLNRTLFPCWGDMVIAISSQVKSHLVGDFKVLEKNICLINNGVDFDEFRPVSNDERMLKRKELGIYSSPVIGMIARLSDVKGQDILVSAMRDVCREMPSTTLLLVGQGKTEKLLRQMVEGFGLEDNVIFHPVINQISKILPVFDLIIVPSRQEGFGLSVLEAQASCVPVIASRVGGIPTIIEDGKTGYLVDPESPKLLASKIVSVLNDSNGMQMVKLSAKKFAEENFSSDSMVDKTIEVYSKLIDIRQTS